METFLFIALVTLALAGVALAAFTLPGSWIILASAIGYDCYFGWQRFGWKWLVALGAIALAAEIVELAASAVVAGKAGASRRAAVGSLLGGFAGMLLLSVPIPVIGTILGGFIGCFIGALAGEMTLRDDLRSGVRVGLFATLGRLLGMMVKISAAMAIAGAVISLAFIAIW
jgi:uncharacterized protein YqgC (DUF456 family)